MEKKLRPLLISLLTIIVIALISTTILRYNVTPNAVFKIGGENFIADGSFENFSEKSGDCCTTPEKASEGRVFASKSKDAFLGEYSLNLTSLNHCACINKLITNFSKTNLYFLSFYYKGDNSKVCNWISGDNKCSPLAQLNKTNKFTLAYYLLTFTDKSTSASIYFYADNSQGKATVTNLYDALEVHKLLSISNPSSYIFNNNDQYIFRTKADNRVVGEMISEIDAKSGEAYFLSRGKPVVTIKFPWSEVVIVIIMMLIIVRLLFKKEVEMAIEGAVKDAKEDAKKDMKNIKEVEEEIEETVEEILRGMK